MNEETTISFKEETGFRISNETDITTGKIVINGIEITSIEDWDKVTHSIVELQQENKQLSKQIEIMEKYLELIKDLGFDYDGLDRVDSLKSLIDELVNYASLGRDRNVTKPIYVNEEKKYNILHEPIKESDVK